MLCRSDPGKMCKIGTPYLKDSPTLVWLSFQRILAGHAVATIAWGLQFGVHAPIHHDSDNPGSWRSTDLCVHHVGLQGGHLHADQHARHQD